MKNNNPTMMQYFHWDYPDDGSLWNKIVEDAPALSRLGVTALWLPPPTKAFERGNPGYAIYDLWDLGEFDQKGSVRTKYGTRAELERAIAAAHQSGVELYLDVVFNHKAGADATERVRGTPVNANNRNVDEGPEQDIDAWTHFGFAGRGGRYSTMQWNHDHFDSVDYDNITRTQRIFRICNRKFETVISPDQGNYDFLMFADVDSSKEDVRKEFVAWGEWMVNSLGFDGFRIDAAKHISADLFVSWFKALDERRGNRGLFAVGEYFDDDLNELTRYLDALGGRMSLFDFPLYFKLHAASQGGSFDMKSLFAGTISVTRPGLAVTFVENHDTAREDPIADWFKPLAYAVILLRAEGYPCVFYQDYFGATGRTSHRGILDILLAARRDFAFGPQQDYLDDQNVVGWTRLGDSSHPHSMAVLFSNGRGGSKSMRVERPNTSFTDVTGNIRERITTDANGVGVFRCNDGSVSVWVQDVAGKVLPIGTAIPTSETPAVQKQSANSEPSSQPTDASGLSLTVFFKRPSDWGQNVRVHYWGTRTEGRQSTWPGVSMEPRDGDWYAFTFSGIQGTRLVFNDGAGHQTRDLARERDGWFLNDQWHDADPEERAPEVTARPRGGKYAAPVTVTLDGTNDTEIEVFFTFDDPANASARWERYREPIRIEKSATLATRAARVRGHLGLVRLLRYEIDANVAATDITITPSIDSGVLSAPTAVSYTINAGPNAEWTAYYTLDGSEPTAASPVYAKSSSLNPAAASSGTVGSPIKVDDPVHVKFFVVGGDGRELRACYCYSVSGRIATTDFRDETIYFVITTRFYEGDPSTSFYCRDRIQFVDGKPVDPHWRGDFKGLIQQLDYIRDLGFTAIWITPPVENRSGLDYHGYHAYDWTKIDPRLESEGATYEDLIREVHVRGMKIVQDVVINHSSQYGIRNKVWINHLPIKYYVPQGSQQGKVNLGPYQGNLGAYSSPYREDNDNPVAPEWFRARQNQDAEGILPLTDPVTNVTVPRPGYNPGRFFGVDPATLDKTWYHQEGFIAGGDWESARPLEQKHMAGDCLDLNTESDVVKTYIMESIDRYLTMGVDGLRIDTVKHIERGNLLEYVNHWKGRSPSVFIFGEALVKGTGWGDLFGDDNGPSAIRPWWYTRLGNDPRDPNSGGDSGFSVLDFSLFSTFRDNIANGTFSGIGGILARDYVYGDASRLVTFFQNHDVGPDNDFRYRFRGEAWKAALAYNLLWTIRGIPCLYYGEEIEFMRGAPQDIIGNNDTLESTGRAYFGDHLLPERIAETKNHVLYAHIKRLNLVRKSVPALRRGAMRNVSEWGGGLSFIRDNNAEGSYAVVGLAAGGNGQDITVGGVENGNYVDVITGRSVTVSNGSLSFHVKPVSIGIYVKNGPGKLGEDLEFLQ